MCGGWLCLLRQHCAIQTANSKERLSWARRMSSNIPAFGALDEHDFVLLSVDQIPLVDDRLTLAKLIETSSRRKITGIAVVGEVTAQDIKAADLHKMFYWLCRIPQTCAISNAILSGLLWSGKRNLTGAEANIPATGATLFGKSGSGSAIAEALRGIVNKSVVIQDENLVIQSWSLTDSCPFTSDRS